MIKPLEKIIRVATAAIVSISILHSTPAAAEIEPATPHSPIEVSTGLEVHRRAIDAEKRPATAISSTNARVTVGANSPIGIFFNGEYIGEITTADRMGYDHSTPQSEIIYGGGLAGFLGTRDINPSYSDGLYWQVGYKNHTPDGGIKGAKDNPQEAGVKLTLRRGARRPIRPTFIDLSLIVNHTWNGSDFYDDGTKVAVGGGGIFVENGKATHYEGVFAQPRRGWGIYWGITVPVKGFEVDVGAETWRSKKLEQGPEIGYVQYSPQEAKEHLGRNTAHVGVNYRF